MLDKTYLEELRELELTDKAEAKKQLCDFALENYKIEVSASVQRRSLDFIIETINGRISKLAAEPMPEQNEGLTVGDIILADDDLNGKNLSEQVPKPEAVELIKAVGVTTPPVIEVVAEDYTINTINADVTPVVAEQVETIAVVGLDVEKETVVAEVEVEQLKEIVKEAVAPTAFEFPAKFSPTVHLVGPTPGYATIPYWVWDFINNDVDWKDNISKVKHPTDAKTLYSLLYYIQKNGCVKIRESRNSQYHIIK